MDHAMSADQMLQALQILENTLWDCGWHLWAKTGIRLGKAMQNTTAKKLKMKLL